MVFFDYQDCKSHIRKTSLVFTSQQTNPCPDLSTVSLSVATANVNSLGQLKTDVLAQLQHNIVLDDVAVKEAEQWAFGN